MWYYSLRIIWWFYRSLMVLWDVVQTPKYIIYADWWSSNLSFGVWPAQHTEVQPPFIPLKKQMVHSVAINRQFCGYILNILNIRTYMRTCRSDVILKWSIATEKNALYCSGLYLNVKVNVITNISHPTSSLSVIQKL